MMHQKIQELQSLVQYKFQHAKTHSTELIQQYWFKTLLIGIVGYMVLQKDLSINLDLNSVATPYYSQSPTADATDRENGARPMNTSLLNKARPVANHQETRPAAKATKAVQDPNLANTFSNMSFDDDEKAKERAEKRRKQLAYVDRYADIAKTEMRKFGIPASITLAQGLLESNVGESRLATKNNNHFGIKCFSRSCKKGHCSNFTDDSHKDFFRKYGNSWDSFRSHSNLLKLNKRYASLFKLKKSDYKGWAHGLKSAGYATDKRYAYKLIRMIEDLDLHKYDR
ncbi:MAG: hypothetical protein DHS20C18_00710 [Saprospiraceae bacterium]|nr:MAG: hypothetical protein DHS20C18_00710 [Saprospiraceae bacterium]